MPDDSISIYGDLYHSVSAYAGSFGYGGTGIGQGGI